MSNVDMPSGGSDRVKPQWKSLLFFTTKRHLIPTALATGCSLVSGLIVPLLAALLGAIFNDFARYGSHAISNTELLENVSKWCLYLCALGAAIGVWHTTQFALWVACGELQAKVARETVFDALLRADLQWFETVEDGVAALLPRIQS
jgi:ATP-binding cassette subfamily B (MDR/TAP) protein 1